MTLGARSEKRQSQDEAGIERITASGHEGKAPLSSGSTLTKDSSWLADMRVWLDEERHRSPAGFGRP